MFTLLLKACLAANGQICKVEDAQTGEILTYGVIYNDYEDPSDGVSVMTARVFKHGIVTTLKRTRSTDKVTPLDVHEFVTAHSLEGKHVPQCHDPQTCIRDIKDYKMGLLLPCGHALYNAWKGKLLAMAAVLQKERINIRERDVQAAVRVPPPQERGSRRQQNAKYRKFRIERRAWRKSRRKQRESLIQLMDSNRQLPAASAPQICKTCMEKELPQRVPKPANDAPCPNECGGTEWELDAYYLEQVDDYVFGYAKYPHSSTSRFCGQFIDQGYSTSYTEEIKQRLLPGDFVALPDPTVKSGWENGRFHDNTRWCEITKMIEYPNGSYFYTVQFADKHGNLTYPPRTITLSFGPGHKSAETDREQRRIRESNPVKPKW